MVVSLIFSAPSLFINIVAKISTLYRGAFCICFHLSLEDKKTFV